MKLILLISVISLFNFSSDVFCQEASVRSTELRSSKVETSKVFNPHKRAYLYETNKLLKFFKAGSIPAAFPKATSYNSKEEYLNAVQSYVNQNPEILNLTTLTQQKKAKLLIANQVKDNAANVSRGQVSEWHRFKRDVPVSQSDIELKKQKQQQKKSDY